MDELPVWTRVNGQGYKLVLLLQHSEPRFRSYTLPAQGCERKPTAVSPRGSVFKYHFYRVFVSKVPSRRQRFVSYFEQRQQTIEEHSYFTFTAAAEGNLLGSQKPRFMFRWQKCAIASSFMLVGFVLSNALLMKGRQNLERRAANVQLAKPLDCKQACKLIAQKAAGQRWRGTSGVGGKSLLHILCSALLQCLWFPAQSPACSWGRLRFTAWEHLPVPCRSTLPVPVWDACQFPAWGSLSLPLPCLGTLAAPECSPVRPAWECLPWHTCCPRLLRFASSLPGTLASSLPWNTFTRTLSPSFLLIGQAREESFCAFSSQTCHAPMGTLNLFLQ